MNTVENKYLQLTNNYPKMAVVEINRELKLKLLGLAQIIGITNVPNDAMLNSIAGFIKEKYFDFTFEEIQQAFSMYAAGEIGDEPGTDHFKKTLKKENSTFNAVFIGSVLNEYRVFRRERIKNSQRIDQSKQLEQKNEIPYDVQCKEHFETYTEIAKKAGKIDIPLTNWNKIFHHLEYTGAIKMTNDEKLEYMIQIKNDNLERLHDKLEKESLTMNERNKVRDEISEYNNENILVVICRKNKCVEYLNSIKQNETEKES